MSVVIHHHLDQLTETSWHKAAESDGKDQQILLHSARYSCMMAVMTDPAETDFGEVVAANVRSLRAGKGLDQALLAARMRSLGFESWRRQTVGSVESGTRKVSVEEVLGLCISLSVAIPSLTTPLDGVLGVKLPSGVVLPAGEVKKLSGFGVAPYVLFRWEGSEPIRPPGDPTESHSRMTAGWGGWPKDFTPEDMADYLIRILRSAAEESGDPLLRAKADELETPEGRSGLLPDARRLLYEPDPEEEW